jgi:hypothetical protein
VIAYKYTDDKSNDAHRYEANSRIQRAEKDDALGCRIGSML